MIRAHRSGRRPASTRRWRAAAAVVASIACACVVPAAGASPGSVRPAAGAARTAQDAPAATIRLLSQPLSVGPDDDFTVFLEIDGATPGSDLAVDIYDRLDDPGQVGAPTSDPVATFLPPLPLVVPESGPTTTGFTVHLYQRGGLRPPFDWAYALDEPGVYPLRVRLRDADQAQVTTFTTQIIRRPAADEEVHTAQVAVVTEVHQKPGADPGRTPLPAGYREDLDRTLGAIRSHGTVPATFAVTPETLDRMVADPDSASLLGRLRAEVRREGREVLDAPYVDIDPGSLVQAGLSEELTRQRDLGRATLQGKLADPTAGSWWMHRAVGAPALEALRERGIFRGALTERSFRQAPALAATDVPAGDGTIRAVPVDDAYEVGPTTDDPTLAAHQMLARLTLAGSTQGTEAIVVTVDPERADPLALPIVLDGLAFGAPFLAGATIDDVLTSTPLGTPPAVADITPRQLGSYGERSRQAHADLASYASMVVGRPELVTRYERPLAVSASSNLTLARRNAMVTSVDRRLASHFRQVHTPPTDRVTLGARDAEFPLVITSSLRYPVRVLIELEANDRVSFPRNRISETLQPGRTVVKIRVHARASGDTPVRILVRSADGRVVLTASRYTIRSTAVSGVGLLLTAGAAVFLAVWWGRHWRRTRRTPKHARGRSHHPASTEM